MSSAFVTLIRFDAAYHGLFKTNRRQLADYPRLRLRLREANRTESPMRLLERLSRIHLQSVHAPDGQRLHGLSELSAEQRELFAAIGASITKAAQMHPPAAPASAVWAPL